MSMEKPARVRLAGILLVATPAAVVFWRTAYPTINWWDSAQYSLAAGTLGITGPPGSLLLTLLGWPVAHLPTGSSPAHLLNLLAGTLAALAVGLVFTIGLRLWSLTPPVSPAVERGGVTVFGAALGALTFAFSPTLWEYAVQFTPYVLTAVFTGLILWVMLRWWEDADRAEAWRWLALLGLLFGLDFSVHRTNSLLLPGVLAWILLRRPGTFRTPRSLVAGIVGMLAGLSVQLLIIPIALGAMTRSPLFWNDPTTWSRFWDYVTLSHLGGGFQVHLVPRKADFWSVQALDLLHVLGANFFRWSGPAGPLGMLPAGAALLGLASLWRRDRRLAIAYAVVLFLLAAMTVLFFNIPPQFFRTFDRHYLPVCVIVAGLMAYGCGTAMRAAARFSLARKWVVAVPAGMFAVLGPPSQLMDDWGTYDASRRYFTREFATNLLTSLPPRAILFTVGDNDTFPLLYFQAVEGVRPDVTVINQSVANLPAFAEELLARDSTVPLAYSHIERAAWSGARATPGTITVPVAGTAESLGLAPGVTPPTAITFTVKSQYGDRLLPAEITVLDIVHTNRWRRPLCFAITGTQRGMGWLEHYGRLEGLYWRVVPMVDPPPDVSRLRANLLGHADYRGYADPTIRLDHESRTLGIQPYVALPGLLEAERKRGDLKACRADAGALLAAIPPERVELPSDYREQIASGCGPERAPPPR
jgi:transmembrane protein TMEM260 (protein O-mannosyltransferase)